MLNTEFVENLQTMTDLVYLFDDPSNLEQISNNMTVQNKTIFAELMFTLAT